MNKQKQNKITKYTIMTLIVIQLVTLGWVTSLQITLNARDDTDALSTTKTTETISELRFCLDNQIRPCTTLAIEEWNTEHPGNSFIRTTAP